MWVKQHMRGHGRPNLSSPLLFVSLSNQRPASHRLTGQGQFNSK